jgi:hypothetical protein
MREIADDFLLHVAEISATLVGLFFVGIFLYVQTALGRGRDPIVEARYVRSSAQVVIVLSAISIGLSLTLVALEPIWNRLLFVALSILLIVATVDQVRRVRELAQTMAVPMLVGSEVIATAAAVLVITVPWVLGGADPSREDFTWAILLAFASGIFSIWAMVMIAFDIGARSQADGGPPSDG